MSLLSFTDAPNVIVLDATETLTTIYITKKFNVSLLFKKYHLQCLPQKCRIQQVLSDIVSTCFVFMCESFQNVSGHNGLH